MLKFLNETVHAEGSYAALVTIYGAEYAVHYVNQEIRVYATRAMNPRSWKTSKNPKTVKKLIAARIASFGPEFLEAHKTLYSETP